MKRSLRTQKQNTIRWAAAILLLLALMKGLDFWEHHPVYSPEQALRSAEAWLGAEETEVIAVKEAYGAAFYLSYNEDTLMLTPFQFGLSSNRWNQGRPELSLALRQGSHPVQANFLTYTDPDTHTEHLQIIGIVSLPDAVTVTAYHPGSTEVNPLHSEIHKTNSGVQYFWIWEDSSSDVPLNDTTLDLLDENGTVLYTHDLLSWLTTTY